MKTQYKTFRNQLNYMKKNTKTVIILMIKVEIKQKKYVQMCAYKFVMTKKLQNNLMIINKREYKKI